MAGLSQSEVDDIVGLLIRLNERGITIVLIEHIMRAVMKFCSGWSCWSPAARSPTASPTRSFAIPRWRRPTLDNKLTIEKVDAAYGSVRVLENVSLNVNSGETVVLLGTNGNGKSTLMKCVMGIVRPRAGRIVAEIDGETHDLVGRTTEQIVDLGIALVPEGAACSRGSPSRKTCCSAPSARRRARRSKRICSSPTTVSRASPSAARSWRAR